MIKALCAYLFIASNAFAGLPPTTLKGQSETAKPTTFNFITPYNQATTTASSTRMIETGSKEILINPSFEAQAPATGWTITGSYGCAMQTTNVADGKQAYSCSNVNAIVDIMSQSVTPTIETTGTSYGVSIKIATISAGFEVCSLQGGSDYQCVSVNDVSGNFKLYNLYVPGANATSVGIKIKSTTTGSKAIRWDQASVAFDPPSITNAILAHFYLQFGSGATFASGECTIPGLCDIYDTTAPAGTTVTGYGTGEYQLQVPAGNCTGPLVCAIAGSKFGTFTICTPNLALPSGSYVPPTNIAMRFICGDPAAVPIYVFGQITCDCRK